MKNLRYLAGAVLVGLALFMLPMLQAVAQTVAEKTVPDTIVEIPLSSWITAAGEFIGPLIGVAILWMIRFLPKQLADFLKTMRVEQLLQKAISYGINAVAGATKDKPLSINVGSEVLENAIQYVVDNGPGWLIKWAGGEAGIREKIIARMNLDAQAALK